MSRLSRYLHSSASSYVVLAANALFTLGSIPLALKFLGRDEFGVWVVASQLALYLSLLDIGMAQSITRILIDHKDRADFGRAVSTALAVLASQAVVIALLGAVVFTALSGLYGLPEAQRPQFNTVMTWVAVLTGLSFLSRIFIHLLEAHQRQYVTNYAQIAALAANFAAIFFALRAGYGVVSLAIGQFAGWLANSAICAVAVLVLRLAPRPGRPDAAVFRALFGLGWSLFMIQCGAQLIMSSQIFLITRWGGPDEAATWSVCTRPFFLVLTAIYRPFDLSLPAFAEMMTRSEWELVKTRMSKMLRLTCIVAAVGSVLFIFCNQDFVAAWTHKKIEWPVRNDIALGIWMALLAVFHAPTMFIITTKQIGFMRFIFLIEGVFSIALASVLLHRHGIAALVLSFATGSLLLHGAYGFRRIKKMFGLSWIAIMREWILIALAAAAVTASACWVARHFMTDVPAVMRFLGVATAGGCCGGLLLWLRGLDTSLRAEIVAHLPLQAFRRNK